jgi:hypothetical protein
LDALIELSAPTFEQSRNGSYLDNSVVNHNEDIRFLIERKDSVSNIILLLDFVLEFSFKGSFSIFFLIYYPIGFFFFFFFFFCSCTMHVVFVFLVLRDHEICCSVMV